MRCPGCGVTEDTYHRSDCPTLNATKPPVEALPYAQNHGKVSALSSAMGLFGDNKPTVTLGDLQSKGYRIKADLSVPPDEVHVTDAEGNLVKIVNLLTGPRELMPIEGAENRFHRAGSEKIDTYLQDRPDVRGYSGV